jgi:predicted nucleic acid-binding protein
MSSVLSLQKLKQVIEELKPKKFDCERKKLNMFLRK